MIFYKHVPSVTNYPVYVGQLDELLEPYIDTVDEAQAKKMLKLFLTQMDRTILDSFHMQISARERPRLDVFFWKQRKSWKMLFRT